MSLNYKAFQSRLKTKEDLYLWYPILVKEGTVYLRQIAKRIAEKSSVTPGDVYNVIDCLISEMNDKLMNGYSVNLDGLGSFTAVAKAGGQGVETPEEVNSTQIKSLRIQFTPTATRTPMQGLTRAMFEGVEFKRWKGDPYHPDNIAKGNGNNGGNGEDDDDPTA